MQSKPVILSILLLPLSFGAAANSEQKFVNALSKCQFEIHKRCKGRYNEIHKSYTPCNEIEYQADVIKGPQDIVKKLIDRRDDLLKYARKYNVNPRVIVSSILTAHTINPRTMSEQLQVYLWNLKDAKPETALPTHYGIGRISEERFTSIEKLVSNKNNRKPDSKKQILNRIYNEDEDMEYTIALIKQKITAYEEANFPIKDDTKIVASTYGINNVAQTIADHKRKGTRPEINLWGAISMCLEHSVDDVLGSIEKDKNPTYMKDLENGKTYHNLPIQTRDGHKNNINGSGATEQ